MVAGSGSWAISAALRSGGVGCAGLAAERGLLRGRIGWVEVWVEGRTKAVAMTGALTLALSPTGERGSRGVLGQSDHLGLCSAEGEVTLVAYWARWSVWASAPRGERGNGGELALAGGREERATAGSGRRVRPGAMTGRLPVAEAAALPRLLRVTGRAH